jgi:hypothetical protein
LLVAEICAVALAKIVVPVVAKTAVQGLVQVDALVAVYNNNRTSVII